MGYGTLRSDKMGHGVRKLLGFCNLEIMGYRTLVQNLVGVRYAEP